MRLRSVLIAVIVLAALAAGTGFVLSAPRRLPDDALAAAHQPDLAKGENLFWAGGCASCHATNGKKDSPEDRLRLGGGLALKTPFGTFRAPNISSDPRVGVGNWSERDFANAMLRGVAPNGRHYYPAFPYTSYQRMSVADVRDLFAYIKTLPAESNVPAGHELAFPYNVSRGLGLWKLLYLDGEPFRADPSKDAAWNRGAYLVQGPGHCNECHTPRDAFGGLDRARAFAGGPAPEGTGTIPNITPAKLNDWTNEDFVRVFEEGVLPGYDTIGGSMADVVDNTAKLPASDREAMAAYLKSLPPR